MAGPSTAILHAAIVVLLLAGTAQAGDYYRVVRRNLFRCSRPKCGGYYLEKVNTKNSTMYVGGLDFSKAEAGVKPTVDNFVNVLGSFPTVAQGLIVYYGDLVPYTLPSGRIFSNYKNLHILKAYIGLPGQSTSGRGLTYYTIGAGRNTSLANKLNDPSARPLPFLGRSIKAIQPTSFLDLSWQLDQVFKKGALVLGTVKKQGLRSTFNLTGVFIKIPVAESPCPVFKIACNAGRGGYVAWTRSADRCFKPVCLYEKRFCPLFFPNCPPGYVLAAWKAPPGGCNSFACDPIFAPPATKLTLM